MSDEGQDPPEKKRGRRLMIREHLDAAGEPVKPTDN